MSRYNEMLMNLITLKAGFMASAIEDPVGSVAGLSKRRASEFMSDRQLQSGNLFGWGRQLLGMNS